MHATSRSGQIVVRKSTPYQDGTVDLSNQPAGMYIVTLTSSDGKYQHTSKVFKK
ncbi:MAG: T9SS type A sorting domain-containing protein [bacterium]